MYWLSQCILLFNINDLWCTMKTALRFISIFILLILLGGIAVGLTDIGKVCLFSGISGVINLNGKPVAYAKVIRTVKKGRQHQDETTTDKKGYFSFPPIYEWSITKYLPVEFVVSQKIKVEYKNKVYKLWSGVKRTEEENAESRGKPLVVQCQLNLENKHKSVNGSEFFTLCEWDIESKPTVNMDNLF